MDVIGQNFDNGRFEINEMNFTHEDILYDPNQQEMNFNHNEYMNGYFSQQYDGNYHESNHHDYMNMNEILHSDIHSIPGHQMANDPYQYNHNLHTSIPPIPYDFNIKEETLSEYIQYQDDDKSYMGKSKPKRRREVVDDSNNNEKKNVIINAVSFPYVKPPISLSIDGIPPKSRVEKQIKMLLKFMNEDGSPSTRYKYIFISENQIAPYTWKKKNTYTEEEINYARASPHLNMRCRIVGYQNRDKEILRCVNCVQRELKTFKKKTKKLDSYKLKEEVQNELNEILNDEIRLKEEKSRIIQFYTGKFVEIKNGEALLPLRITCYCRHHKEPHGFSIELYISDGNTREHVITARTSYILITDDHKATKRSKKKRKFEENYNGTTSGDERNVIHNNNTNNNNHIHHQNGSPRSSSSDISNDIQTQQNIHSYDNNNSVSYHSYVEKVIPKYGPLSGGVEVTVLGKNFLPHHVCYFGELRTSVSQYWNTGTIVCILPPSKIPGPVPVSVILPEENNGGTIHSNQSATFVYNDDEDKKILELALQLVGVQFTGQLQDAKKIAMDIVNRSGQNFNSNGENIMNNSSQQQSTEFLACSTINYLIETSRDDQYINLSIKNSTGHTLLHYSIIKGYKELFYLLLDCYDVENIYLDLNSCDNNGYTPLHFSVIFDRHEMAIELLYMGASPYINNESGDIPIDFSRDEKMREILQHDYTSTYSLSEEAYSTTSSLSNDIYDNNNDDIDIENNEDSITVSMDESSLSNNENKSNDINNKKNKEKEDDSSDFYEGTELRKRLSYFWMLIYHWISLLWNTYRFPLYIGLLIVLGGLLIVEYVPFRLSKGIVSSPGDLLTDGRGNAPHSVGNDPGLKIFSLLANLPWWQIYFAFRWLIVCSILFGIIRYFKSKMRKPIALTLIIITIILFFVGLLYIFHAIG